LLRDPPLHAAGDIPGITMDEAILVAAHSPAICYCDSASIELTTVAIEKCKIAFVYT
jgi:hypothetical protein